MLATLQEAYINQELPDSMTEAYITLLQKKKSPASTVQDYRPISLLNTDYKILTKALSIKLEIYLPELIHPDQQCSIKGRNILNHTHFIRDLITYTRQKKYSSQHP